MGIGAPDVDANGCRPPMGTPFSAVITCCGGTESAAGWMVAVAILVGPSCIWAMEGAPLSAGGAVSGAAIAAVVKILPIGSLHAAVC